MKILINTLLAMAAGLTLAAADVRADNNLARATPAIGTAGDSGLVTNGFKLNGLSENGLRYNALTENGYQWNALTENGQKFNGQKFNGLNQGVGGKSPKPMAYAPLPLAVRSVVLPDGTVLRLAR